MDPRPPLVCATCEKHAGSLRIDPHRYSSAINYAGEVESDASWRLYATAPAAFPHKHPPATLSVTTVLFEQVYIYVSS